jgi:hypothetical protein
MWLREVRKTEERESRPPEGEISRLHKLEALRREAEQNVKGKKKAR